MTSLHFRAKQLFLEAIERHDELGTEAWLRDRCGGDEQLLSSVTELVRAHRSTDTLIEVVEHTERESENNEPMKSGQCVGPYVIAHLLGEGGMGLVYLAHQRGHIERDVALKIVKPGMDTREVLQRFRLEQRSLARLQHPNIASVLDAGQTADGQPYFVMELVPGQSLTQFCDSRRLNIITRLQLFQQVCAAVTHAHQRGIIHRDLKPNNILVADQPGEPTPKIIDFGLVKAMTGSDDARERVTQIWRVVGTPHFMSPEQAQRDDGAVDTRSDIYSLGVILHQLLIDKTPLGYKASGSHEGITEAGIRENWDVQRPSRSFRSLTGQEREQIASLRSCDSSSLGRQLQSDLDWIVVKALEESPKRRYQSADALSDDIGRFLAGDVIEARPPSWLYRAKKTASKNRGLLSTACAVVLALMIGLAVAVHQRGQAEQARLLAERSLEEVEVQKSRAEALLYASDIRLAARALEGGDVYQALELLKRHQPDASSASPTVDPPGLEWTYLMRQVSGTPLQTIVSDQPLYTVCLSPNGEHLLTAGAAGKIFVLDADSLKVEHSFDSGQVEVNALAFDRAGETLVSTGDDGTIRLWNTTTYDLQQTITFGSEKAYEAVFDPSGEYLIACGQAKDLRVFLVHSGEQIRSLHAHERSVEQLLMAPDGKVVCAVSSDGRVSQWDWQSGERLRFLHPERYRLSCLDQSADGVWTVVGTVRGQVRLLWPDYGSIVLPDGLQGIAFSPNGESIAAATRAGSIYKLDRQRLSTGDEPIEHAVVKRLHTGRAYDLCWIDDATLVSVGEDGRANRINVANQQDTRGEVPEIRAGAVSVSPQGDRIAWQKDNRIGVFDLISQRAVEFSGAPDDFDVSHFSFAPDGRSILLGSTGKLLLVSLEDQESAESLPIRDVAVSELEFSRIGDRLLLVSRPDKRVIVYDYPDMSERFHRHVDDVPYASLSSDGKQVVIGAARDLSVWDVDSGKRISQSLEHHDESISDVLIVPGSNQIVSVGGDRAVKTWDGSGDSLPNLLGLHQRPAPLSIELMSDDQTLLTCSWGGDVILWNLASRQKLMTLCETNDRFLGMESASERATMVLLHGKEAIEWFSLDGTLMRP